MASSSSSLFLHAYRNLRENLLKGCSSFLGLSLLHYLKKNNNNNKEVEYNDYYRRWDELHVYILENIIERLDLVDCVRVSKVCKSWRSVALQQKMRIKAALQVPWLLLSHPSPTKNLQFFDFSSGSFHNITLPWTALGWWYIGSSNGWLVIAKGSDVNPKLVLFNPNSGVQLRLPSLQTIPSFKDFHLENYDCDYDITHFVGVIKVSSEDASNCIVAASFYDRKKLALCRPEDESWSIFEGADDENNYCEDILFYDGMLYVLLFRDDYDLDADLVATRSMRIGDDVVVVIRLIPLGVSLRTSCVIVDPTIWVPEDESGVVWIGKYYRRRSYLVVSNAELLIVHQIINIILHTTIYIDGEEEEDDDYFINDDGSNGNDDDDCNNNNEHNDEIDGDNNNDNDDDDDDDDDDGSNSNSNDNDNDDGDDDDDDEENTMVIYRQTSKFEVFKIDDPHANYMSVTRQNNLGDQMLFVSKLGSKSVPPASKSYGLKKNCIFFVEEGNFYFISRESGIFYLEDERIERCFPSMEYDSTHNSHISWYSPNL